MSRIPALAEETGRERSLDLLRGVGAVGMVCAHVSWALLEPGGRTGTVWSILDILFGSVAPLYLFLSGITLHRSLERNSGREGARRRTLRAVRLLLFGIWLQIPILSLRQIIWNHQPAQLAQLLDCNVLHVVGLAALLLIGISSLLSLRAAVVSAGLLAAVLLFTEPLLATLLPHRSLLDPLLRGLVGPQPPATLPLLPFLLYPLAGFACGKWGLGEHRRERGLWCIAGGGGIALLAVLLNLLLPSPHFWENSPCYLLFRLGTVAIALGLAGSWSSVPSGRVVRLTEWMGRGSLAIYVIHFVLLYGSPLSTGAMSWWNGALVERFAPVPVVLLAALILALSLALWWLWLRLRLCAPLVAFGSKRLFWAIFWGIFLTRP